MLNFPALQAELNKRGLKCVNLIEKGKDVYHFGRLDWDDWRVEAEGYAVIFPSDENDFDRYEDMLVKSDKIMYLF